MIPRFDEQARALRRHRRGLLDADLGVTNEASEDWSTNAQSMFDHADDLNRQGRLDEALQIFDECAKKFPYSRNAAKSELRAADIVFNLGDYAAASRRYREWARAHASNPLEYRVAKRGDLAACLAENHAGCASDELRRRILSALSS